MTLGLSDKELMRVIESAQDAGIRLEVHQGLPIWEFLPSPIHTIETKRIEGSIRSNSHDKSGCGCFSFQDMSVRFPDGSIRRPDISVFSELPAATQEATSLVPAAVIEVVSPGSEVKDLARIIHGTFEYRRCLAVNGVSGSVGTRWTAFGSSFGLGSAVMNRSLLESGLFEPRRRSVRAAHRAEAV